MIAVINESTTIPSGTALQPLSPRSIVLSVLLGSHPPTMPVGHLLEFTGLFGLADGTVRTALSRMVAAGDLAADDGVYRLSERLRRRQHQQDSGRTPPPTEWDGSWWVAVVTAERRSIAERRSFRSQMVGARFGELRPDIWLRPANIDVPLDLPDVALTRGPLLTGDADRLVSQLWDLDDLEHAAVGLLADLDRVSSALEPPVLDAQLPDAFAVLAGCQRFLRTEPQLPAPWSEGTTAAALRVRYDLAVERFQLALGTFFRRARTR